MINTSIHQDQSIFGTLGYDKHIWDFFWWLWFLGFDGKIFQFLVFSADVAKIKEEEREHAEEFIKRLSAQFFSPPLIQPYRPTSMISNNLDFKSRPKPEIQRSGGCAPSACPSGHGHALSLPAAHRQLSCGHARRPRFPTIAVRAPWRPPAPGSFVSPAASWPRVPLTDGCLRFGPYRRTRRRRNSRRRQEEEEQKQE